MRINEIAMLLGALVLILAVCVPIMGQFADQQSDTETVQRTNTTIYHVTKAAPQSAALTITYDTDTGGATVAIGSAQVQVEYLSGLPLLITGIYCLKFSGSGDLRLFTDSNIVQSVQSVTVAAGSMEVVRGTTTQTTTTYELTEDVYYIAPSGAYGLFTTFKANADSPILLNWFFSSFSGSRSVRGWATGTYADGMDVHEAYSSVSSSATTDVTDSTTISYLIATPGHGCVTISGFHLSSMGSEGNKTDAYFVAPLAYTEEETTETMVGTLVGIAPVLLVVGVIVAIVVSMRREDSLY